MSWSWSLFRLNRLWPRPLSRRNGVFPTSDRLVLLTEKALPTCKSGCKSWKANKELQESVLSCTFAISYHSDPWQVSFYKLPTVMILWRWSDPMLPPAFVLETKACSWCSHAPDASALVNIPHYPSQSLSAGDGSSVAQQHISKDTKGKRKHAHFQWPVTGCENATSKRAIGCLLTS